MSVPNQLPGNVEWLPAADHPQLLAPVTAGAIGGMEAYVAAIDPDLADTAAFCAQYAVGLEVSSNCVIVEGRRSGEIRRAAVMVLGVDRADINKVVKKHLDVSRLSFAKQEIATSLSRMEYGGINPVGLPSEWPILVDEQVAALDWAVMGSGVRGSKLAIRGADLAGLPAAEVLPLALPR